MSAYETYDLGDFKLQNGSIIPDAYIAYKTYGKADLPAVLFPTAYSGNIDDNEWLIGEDKTLNPQKYFIIVTALFGNGQSISPSNSDVSPFPDIAFYDNVRAQHQVVTEKLKIKHLRAVTGWSMGGAQTFQWATQYPDFMDIAAPFCGSARTALHKNVFLEGQKSILLTTKGQSSPGVAVSSPSSSRTWTSNEKTTALKAFGRAYAAWGFSQAFYRHKLFEKYYGAKSLEEFLVTFWETWACSKDPENLLVMLQTWQSGDISKQSPYDGDFEKALASIKAQTLVMPAKTDLYFPPEDSEYEVEHMSPGIGRLEVFPGIWGHWAGGAPGDLQNVKWLDDKLAIIFAEAPVRGV